MRLTLLLHSFTLLLITSSLSAQIPNGGFENWTAAQPDNWISNNADYFEAYPITQSDDSHNGSSAARGEVIADPFGGTDPYAPILVAEEFMIDSEPEALTGWYKMISVDPADYLTVAVVIVDADGNATGIGVSANNSSTSYAQFSIPIDYTYGSDGAGVTATVSFTISDIDGDPDLGSVFFVDDVSFGMAVGLEESKPSFTIDAIWPQPCTDHCSLQLDVNYPQHIEIDLLDIVGRVVSPLPSVSVQAGRPTIDIAIDDHVPNGLYLLRFKSPHGEIVRRIVIR